jgi:hypothetical protein
MSGLDKFDVIFNELNKKIVGLTFKMTFDNYAIIDVYKNKELICTVKSATINGCADLAAEKLITYKKNNLED